MNNQKQDQPIKSPDALFHAPMWATKMLTGAAWLGIFAIVSLVVGVALAIKSENPTPAGVGLLLFVALGLPGFLLQLLTRQSLGSVYGGEKAVQSSGPNETVIVFPRDIKVRGKGTDFGTDRFTVKAPADQVSRMLQWIKEHPDRLSRTQVMAGAKVSQPTWERVMTALEQVGVVVNNGKSGYAAAESLDEKLDRLDARL